jgi:PEGA domain
MRKGLLTAAVALAALVTLGPLPASAADRHGGFVGGPRASFGFWYGPYFGPYWGPFWGVGWGWGPGYGRYYNSGEVKLDTRVKDAEVYVNGGYAGTTHDNKTMHLRPGGYKIEIREGGQTRFTANIYVQPGRTVHLHPEL